MQNTYLYIRFSDDKQAQGTSYVRQLQYARDYCPTLIEDRTHIFFDSGKSAYSGANIANGGELRRFYDAVADGSIPKGSTLLVEDLGLPRHYAETWAQLLPQHFEPALKFAASAAGRY